MCQRDKLTHFVHDPESGSGSVSNDVAQETNVKQMKCAWIQGANHSSREKNSAGCFFFLHIFTSILEAWWIWSWNKNLWMIRESDNNISWDMWVLSVFRFCVWDWRAAVGWIYCVFREFLDWVFNISKDHDSRVAQNGQTKCHYL